METIFDLFSTEIADSPSTNHDLSQRVMTLAEHQKIFAKIRLGELQEANVVREHFERLCRDLDSVTAELKSLTKDKIKDWVSYYTRSDLGKEGLVQKAVQSLLDSYGVLYTQSLMTRLTSESHSERNRQLLAKLTDDHLRQIHQKHLEAIAQRELKQEAINKALTNPETLKEFEFFIAKKGAQALTPTMQSNYDALKVGAQKKAADTPSPEAIEAKSPTEMHGALQILETKHTRDHHDLFVVKPERVSPDDFKRLCSVAKRHNGYYSKFASGGAIPGFQFKDRLAAEAFVSEIQPNTTKSSNPNQQSNTVSPSYSVGEKLLESGRKAEARASERLNQDRKANTARRARMASYIEAEARQDIAKAKTVQNVAQSIINGDANHLAHIKHATQIELLITLLQAAKAKELANKYTDYASKNAHKDDPVTLDTVYYVQYPQYHVDANILATVALKLATVTGLKRHAAALSKAATAARRDGNANVDAEFIDEICAKAVGHKSLLHWSWDEAWMRRKRLISMDVKSIEELRMACRELVVLLKEKDKADPIKELERKVIGSVVGIDFFPTKPTYATYMVKKAGVEPGKRALEPQAGNGNIAMEIRNAGVEPDVCEISSTLREILEAKGFNVVAQDFLDHQGVEYDVIVANPPFSNNLDIVHTKHAYNLLAPKGCLTTIVGEGAFHRSGNVESEFRHWLATVDAEIEPVPEDTFSDPNLLAQTKARARLVTIRRA